MKWTDEELMLWALARGWSVVTSPTGWKWSYQGENFQVYTHEIGTAGATADADIPAINDRVRARIIERLHHLGLVDEEGNRWMEE